MVYLPLLLLLFPASSPNIYVLCSYKLVDVRFDMMYLMQGRIEEFVQKVRLGNVAQLLDWADRVLTCPPPRVSGRSCWWPTGRPSHG